ncbi:MAG TPA: UPF0261 family protein [Anaerolineae bacterium]|nr:UPF0261 family protein [Anaerolineae bacterium]
MSKPKTVVVVATLDTKGKEAEFIKDKIAAQGIDTILIDSGILGSPTVKATISRNAVAQAAGVTTQALKEQGQKSVAIAKQSEGLSNIVKALLVENKLDGIIGIGGGQGTSICTTAMQALPVGLPKLMLSTVASGRFRFGPYVGDKDICMMFSVTDIAGLNAISRPILDNAANAIAGMVLHKRPNPPAEKPAIAITMLGITTPCVMRIKASLETMGYDVVAFHASGSGGAAMEELIEAGKFVAVLDLSTHELINHLNGGLAGTPGRLEAITRTSIPAVISVGGIDVLAFESNEKTPKKYLNRPFAAHNAQIIHVRPSPKEMSQAAQVMVNRLNKALGPTLVTLPLKGFSDLNQEGRALWGAAGNRALIETLQAGLRPEIPLVQVDAHINDPEFADVNAACMARLIQGESPADVAAQFDNVGEK